MHADSDSERSEGQLVFDAMTTGQRQAEAKAILFALNALSERAFDLLCAMDDAGKDERGSFEREQMRLVWLETRETFEFVSDKSPS
jgi:hypothetical protein